LEKRFKHANLVDRVALKHCELSFIDLIVLLGHRPPVGTLSGADGAKGAKWSTLGKGGFGG